MQKSAVYMFIKDRRTEEQKVAVIVWPHLNPLPNPLQKRGNLYDLILSAIRYGVGNFPT